MKKIYGFLGAAALLSMVACSKDDVGGQHVPEAQGDMFMTMTIMPTGTTGTRTATPNQTQGEVGKDRENTITNALVIFADKTSEGNYKVVTSVYAGTDTDSSVTNGTDGKAMATFKVARNTILTDISGTSTPATSGSKTYYIFVVANAPSGDGELATKFGSQADLQQIFETSGDESKYWKENKFLMSNSMLYTKEINAAEIQPGTFTESSNAYSLNKNNQPVKIQRAMSRFDLATGKQYTVFTTDEDLVGSEDGPATANSDLSSVTVTFDAVALINMAQKAYTFKVTAEDKDAYNGKTILFGIEDDSNWVLSPEQSAFSTPLFGTGAATAGKLTGTTNDLESFFRTEASETAPAAVNRVGGYTLISNITEADNTYERPSDADPAQPDYSIWRYCMENTNPDDVDEQKNGNSTGLVFRAEITGKKVDGEAITSADGPLYSYGSVILGNAEGLRAYAIAANKAENDNTNVFDAVKLKYAAAVKAYNADQSTAGNKFTFEVDKTGEGDWTAPEGSELYQGYKDIRKANATELAGLNTYLVAQDFAIYRPTDGKYYCYYIYWNRHNDNGNNSVMGEMEFATVRNNVYKLRVNKIHKLGHPGKPGDDPDDPKPDDPDEKDSFYCEIICEILPWEVRINELEF